MTEIPSQLAGPRLMDAEDKIFHIYEVLTQRILNSDRLLAERSSMYLLTNSILLAGFLFIFGESGLLQIVIPSAGIILSIVFGFVAWGVTREMHLWVIMCQNIEQEQPAFDDLKNQELIPYSAWNYWAQGNSQFVMKPPQRGVPLGLKAQSRWEKLTTFGIFDPWHFYRIYIPSLFVVIWISSLVSVFLL